MGKGIISSRTCWLRRNQTQIRGKCVWVEGTAGQRLGGGNGLGALDEPTDEWVPGEKGVRVRVIGEEVHCPDFLSPVTTVCIPFHCLTHTGTKQASVAVFQWDPG